MPLWAYKGVDGRGKSVQGARDADSPKMLRAAQNAGMRTLRQDGALKVLAGITTIEDVMMVTTEDSA